MRLIRHTGIFVKDLEGMKDFYCRHFDMEVFIHCTERVDYIEKLLGTPSGGVELYKLCRKDGTMVELLRTLNSCEDTMESRSVPVAHLGRMHIAFTVEQLDSLYSNMVSEEIEFLSVPTISPDGKAYVCFCKDPEGNYLELVQDLHVV